MKREHLYRKSGTQVLEAAKLACPNVDRYSLIVELFSLVVEILQMCQIFFFKFHASFRMVSDGFVGVPWGF